MRTIRVVLVAGMVGFAALAHGSAGEGVDAARPLPAPITIRSDYGRTVVSYQIARTESVRRVAPAPSLFSRDAVWYPATGDWFRIHRRHLVIGRFGRTLWRSRGEFAQAMRVGAIQLGQRTVAFTYGNHLYLAPLAGSERLIGRSEVPLGFTRAGLYTYQWGRRLLLRSDTGEILATIARDPFGSGYFIAEDGSLYFIAGGYLERADGAAVDTLVALRSLGLPPAGVALQPVGNLLELEDNSRLVLVREDGTVFAGTSSRAWGGGVPSDSGVLSPRGNAVGFTDTTGRDTERVYVLRQGASRPATVYARRVSFGCEQGAGVQWRGSWLLYSDSDGHVVAIDTAGPRRVVDLTALVKRLPRVRAGLTAYWSAQPFEF